MLPTSALSPYIGPITIAIVLTAAALDLQHRRIPNWLTFGAWLLALPAQLAIHGLASGLSAWGLGWLTGLAMFLPLYVLRGMAAGDVKLMAAVGAWLGPAMALQISMMTFLLGGVWALTHVYWFRHGNQVLRNIAGIARGRARAPSVGSMPYGVPIAAGTLVMLFVGS
ncbi:A24 family peptidase [Cupriavidus consociatus]|uniref:A24 family peptidase n=1 Tax=Cupriavidus consociatus TaxID=2821357 RepID=UPI001AE78390|nr:MULTISPECIES: prepilin peptidase [unclassified Cupriavidus]MBP0622288.1 prepilin peptidase [Cupriavidus sp. LEh25]MDK2658965.1 prepilin peptidase [Cupriavidus sp. LEh21]